MPILALLRNLKPSVMPVLALLRHDIESAGARSNAVFFRWATPELRATYCMSLALFSYLFRSFYIFPWRAKTRVQSILDILRAISKRFPPCRDFRAFSDFAQISPSDFGYV